MATAPVDFVETSASSRVIDTNKSFLEGVSLLMAPYLMSCFLSISSHQIQRECEKIEHLHKRIPRPCANRDETTIITLDQVFMASLVCPSMNENTKYQQYFEQCVSSRVK